MFQAKVFHNKANGQLTLIIPKRKLRLRKKIPLTAQVKSIKFTYG